jgi:hypothetical protein
VFFFIKISPPAYNYGENPRGASKGPIKCKITVKARHEFKLEMLSAACNRGGGKWAGKGRGLKITPDFRADPKIRYREPLKTFN